MGSTWFESLRGRITGAWDVLLGRAYAGYSVPDVMGEVRLRILLMRCLEVADSGTWRDKTNLSIAAHPVWDDVRETLAAGG